MDTIWPEALPKSKGPKYTLVADTIRKAIENKTLEVGTEAASGAGTSVSIADYTRYCCTRLYDSDG